MTAAITGFKIDRKVIGKLLKTAFNAEVDAVAQKIHAHAGENAEFEHYTTDRGAASIAVPAWEQAKHGALTKAAGAAGVRVVGKK